MIVEISARYVSRCGTTSAIIECDTLDTEGPSFEAMVEDAVNEWFFDTIEEEFKTYYRERGGDEDFIREYEEALEKYIEEADLFVDEV